MTRLEHKLNTKEFGEYIEKITALTGINFNPEHTL
jgi:hypothetical protein